jgi:hypothetical protein
MVRVRQNYKGIILVLLLLVWLTFAGVIVAHSQVTVRQGQGGVFCPAPQIDKDYFCVSGPDGERDRVNAEGCLLGRSCCGDGLCQDPEDKDTCARDCEFVRRVEKKLDDEMEDGVGNAIPADMLNSIRAIVGSEVIFQIVFEDNTFFKYIFKVTDRGITANREPVSAKLSGTVITFPDAGVTVVGAEDLDT